MTLTLTTLDRISVGSRFMVAIEVTIDLTNYSPESIKLHGSSRIGRKARHIPFLSETLTKTSDRTATRADGTLWRLDHDVAPDYPTPDPSMKKVFWIAP